MIKSIAAAELESAPEASADVTDTRLFANQFLIAPSIVDGLAGWKRLSIRTDIVVNHHPDLNAVQVRGGKATLTLLGYILDPENPWADDETILRSLLERFASIDALTGATSGYGGRWLIIACLGQHAWIFNDALGLRQAFFTPQPHRGGVWVGSQPGLVAECLDFGTDAAGRAFVDSHSFRTHTEYRWPAVRTPYPEIRHLLPNHYLDLANGQFCRYWPHAPLEPLALNDALDKLTQVLPQLIRAAAVRFDLALGMSAGLDSRLALAASRSIRDELECMTVRQGRMADTADDLVISQRLCQRLDVPHTVVRALPSMSADFSYRFKRSVYMAHDHYGADAEAILAWSQRRKVAMTGSGAEIGRCSFRSQLPDPDRRTITARDLAHLQRMDALEFAIEAFQEWLDGLGESHKINVLDLFEWEQGHGNWLAMTQLEFDSAWKDIFTPYNCRDVLVTLLSVDERYRKKPDYRLYTLAIERLWSEVLTEPLSSGSTARVTGRFTRLGGRLRKVLRRLARST